ncbi:MAG: GGDEF domain-containing protein [Pseudoxanthomonas sp.]|nr:GGDEF domain-containing protein [Pseudoxanthomonas sp.]
MTASPATAPRRSPPLVAAGLHAAVFVAWMAAFLAAWLLEYAPHASLWFPPAAVTFAALLVLGARALPVLWLACLLATALADRMYGQHAEPAALALAAAGFAAAHTGAYAIPAMLLRRFAWGAAAPTTPAKVTLFLLGGLAGAIVAGLGGAFSLRLAGLVAPGEWLPLLAPWWIGDYAGLLTLGPLAAVALNRAAAAAGLPERSGKLRFGAPAPIGGLGRSWLLKLLLLLGGSAALLAAASLVDQPQTVIFCLFAALVVQLWIVHSEPELGVLLAIAAFTVLLVAATTLLGLGGQALILQFVLITLAANSYFGLAVPALYGDNERLRRLVTHDPLTGALSRRIFEEGARAAIAVARRRGEPVVLVMVDVDRLKEINDGAGHAAGDAALRAVADTCAGHVRPGDLIGRLSGDEFAVLLPGAAIAEAAGIVHAIRDALADLPTGPAGPVTASFGLSALEPGDDGYDSLLARADRAMYAVKPDRAGRRAGGAALPV